MNREPSLISGTSTVEESNNAMILRVLSGALRGCEFQLSPGKTLVLIGTQEVEQDPGQLLNIPENTIYLPALEGASNFEILVDGDATVRLRILDQENSQEIACILNAIHTAGTLSFAIKPINQEWSQAVLHPTTVATTIDGMDAVLTRKNIFNFPYIFGVASVVLALVLGTFGYQAWMKSKHQYSNTLSTLLQGSSEKIDILEGRDQVLYVFTNSDRDMSWANQIIVRSKFHQPVKVTTYQDEEASIAKKISNSYPNFFYHAIHLDVPDRPQIFYSATRDHYSQANLNQFTQKLESLLPYAQHIQMIPVDDQAVADQANSALDKLGIRYVRADHSNSVTFLIQGDIEDGNLQRIRNFVDDFNQQWGGHYVQFSIELRDEAFKGKSFLHNNNSSYVKVSPSYWYFLQAH